MTEKLGIDHPHGRPKCDERCQVMKVLIQRKRSPGLAMLEKFQANTANSPG